MARIFLLTFKAAQGQSYFTACKGHKFTKEDIKKRMMAFLRCTRQVEESTGSALALHSVHAKTGYAITYLANTSSPSLSTVQGQNFHNIF